MRRILGNRSGFTLVELLIVVIILGVLAAVAIPQFTSSTDDAREASLDTSLTQLRNAIELYYHQHGNTYPGATYFGDGSAVGSAAQADSSFVRQLTLYTALDGRTSSVKDVTYQFGPYLKTGIPENPFNEMATVSCDIAATDISAVASDGLTGWQFYVQTGRLIANDGSHDTN